MSNNQESVNIFDYALGKLIGGAIFIWGGIYCDSLFTALESGEMESARINWIIALAYNSLGHSPTVWMLYIAGAVAVLFGVKQIFAGQD